MTVSLSKKMFKSKLHFVQTQFMHVNIGALRSPLFTGCSRLLSMLVQVIHSSAVKYFDGRVPLFFLYHREVFFCSMSLYALITQILIMGHAPANYLYQYFVGSNSSGLLFTIRLFGVYRVSCTFFGVIIIISVTLQSTH